MDVLFIAPDDTQTIYSTNSGSLISDDAECGLYSLTYPIERIPGEYAVRANSTLVDSPVEFSTDFHVAGNQNFSIVRRSRTMIDPTRKNSLDMSILIESFNEKNTINITETLPPEFVASCNCSISKNKDSQTLKWEKHLNDNPAEITYSYSVPPNWPTVYQLGPLEVDGYIESRPWYLAVDPATEKLYQGSTFAYMDGYISTYLYPARDGTADYVRYTLSSGNLYTFVSAKSGVVGKRMIISSYFGHEGEEYNMLPVRR